MRRPNRIAGLLALSLLAGCTAETSRTVISPTTNPNAATISGTAQGPGTVFGSGSTDSMVPLAKQTLEVVDPATGSTIGQTTTDASGNYTATVTPTQTTGFHTQQAGGTTEVCVYIRYTPPASAQSAVLKMLSAACAAIGSAVTNVNVSPGGTAALTALAQSAGFDEIPDKPGKDLTNLKNFADVIKAVKNDLPKILHEPGREFDKDPTFFKAPDASQALQAIQKVAANLANQAAELTKLVPGAGQTANDVVLAFRGMMPEMKKQFVPGTAPDLDQMAQNIGGFFNTFKQTVQQQLVSQIAQRPFDLPPGIAKKQFVPPPAPVRSIGVLEITQAPDSTFKAVGPNIGLVPIPPDLRGVVKPTLDPSGNSQSTSFGPPVAIGGVKPVVTQTVTVNKNTGTTTLDMAAKDFPANIPTPQLPKVNLKITGKNNNPVVHFDVEQTFTTPGGVAKTTKGSIDCDLDEPGKTMTCPAGKAVITGDKQVPGFLGALAAAIEKGLSQKFAIRLNRQTGTGGAADVTGKWVANEDLPVGETVPTALIQTGQSSDLPDFSKLIAAIPTVLPSGLPSGIPSAPALPTGVLTQTLADQLSTQYCTLVKQAAALNPTALTQQVVDTACNAYKQALQALVK